MYQFCKHCLRGSWPFLGQKLAWDNDLCVSKTNSCKCLGQNMYRAQQFTAKVMSGQICPDRYKQHTQDAANFKRHHLLQGHLTSLTNGLYSEGVYFTVAHPSPKPTVCHSNQCIDNLFDQSCLLLLSKPVSRSRSNVTSRNLWRHPLMRGLRQTRVTVTLSYWCPLCLCSRG